MQLHPTLLEGSLASVTPPNGLSLHQAHQGACGQDAVPDPSDSKAQRACEGKALKGPLAVGRGTFSIEGTETGLSAEGTLPDTFVSVRGWGKGLAWINGFNLGWCACCPPGPPQ